MKIRIMGTKAECEYAGKYYTSLVTGKQSDIVSSVQVSKLYPNRGSITVFRIYIDVTYKTELIKLEGGDA